MIIPGSPSALFAPTSASDLQGLAALSAAGLPKDQAEALVIAKYAQIGRSGIGPNVYNIDREGYDYWINQLVTGALTPDDLDNAFEAAVANYLATRDNMLTRYVETFEAQSGSSDVTAGVADAVSNALAINAVAAQEQQSSGTVSPATSTLLQQAITELNAANAKLAQAQKLAIASMQREAKATADAAAALAATTGTAQAKADAANSLAYLNATMAVGTSAGVTGAAQTSAGGSALPLILAAAAALALGG